MTYVYKVFIGLSSAYHHHLLKSLSMNICLFCLCGCVACGILVPQPDIGPTPPALEVQNRNHWTTRARPVYIFSRKYSLCTFVLALAAVPKYHKLVAYK